MCGRYVSATPPDELARYFGAEPPGPEAPIGPSHNVAPTQAVYAVFESDGARRLDAFHWGLVPFWAKTPGIGSKMINARAETLASSNAYRRPFARRRCLIPADGFYEWTRPPGADRKQPVYVSRADGEPFAFAGLWEVWKDRDLPDDEGEAAHGLYSCTIVTGEPNSKMAEFHHRMPVILPPSAWDAWLDRDNRDTGGLERLLVPAPSGLLRIRPVSRAVNSVRNNGPHLIDEAAWDEQPQLGA